MKRNRVAVILGVCGVVTLALVGWIYTLPETVSAERSADLPAPIHAVFDLVTRVEDQASWRSDVGRIEASSDASAWTEHGKSGDVLSFKTVRLERDRVFEIAYTSTRGFSGRWIGHFTASGTGTQIRFVEETTIPNPVNRALARLFVPPGSHLDLYLADLRRAASRSEAEQRPRLRAH